ncbi:Uncharacterised protein [Vibrio cholerae]|uniref:Uncharacterized protein n=1 Tax=Vibrio cholerae TaxID=666 RepID=A0A655P0E3_VIBCL|nr:Uncharacterised protein [Vibrio cholerae]CSC12808.1 Uncharacterised protein [Vibrio cholerae]CSC94742.1 Uncharacterised protein [Vibrio cholerae]
MSRQNFWMCMPSVKSNRALNFISTVNNTRPSKPPSRLKKPMTKQWRSTPCYPTCVKPKPWIVWCVVTSALEKQK